MTHEVTTVSFPCENYRLYGTLHSPAPTDSSRTGVIVLNQGPLDRSGAHRLSTKLAVHLNEMALPVLRFDARGVGESEGEWLEPPDGASIQALYQRIFDGAWRADTLAAIDFMVENAGVEQVILAGLCGGASTALHAGAGHKRVSGIAMVGMPVRIEADPQPAELVESFIRSEAQLYARKLFAATAWRRFLTFQTDYRTLLAVARRRALDLVFPRRTQSRPDPVSSLIRSSFAQAVRHRKRLLFVYPENDYLWNEFRDLFIPGAGEATSYQLITVPKANHTFTEPEWQQTLLGSLTEWAAGVASRAR